MHRSCSVLLLLLAILFSVTARPSAAQTLDSGPQVLTIFSEVDDTDQPYALYLPRDFDPSREYPLVISLHGAGSNHRLNLRRVFGKSNAPDENDVEATRYFPEWEDVDYIVASPFARGTMGYQGVAEQDVLDVLADVKRRFSIDENRTYLTGLSMGGGGTLWLGLTRPDVWAAIAPVCPAPPAGTAALAPNALNVPAHIFQGGADPVVNPDTVRGWVDRFEQLGTDVEYKEYPGVGHESWENAYTDGQIFDWFSQFQREAYPERVRFATDRYKYDSAYWVQIDALTPGTLARVDARFTDMNHIDVTTSELEAFTFHLAGHPQFSSVNPLDVRIDGQALTAPPSDTVSFRRTEEGWRAETYAPAAPAKRPGAEGPMRAALASRHIYVYGTGGNPSEAELAARRERAYTAANWSIYRGPFLRRVKVFPRIVADRDVRPSDLESANLILFGTEETNSIIQRFSDRLPIHLAPSAEEHGLVYVFPVGKNYVLVNSGLPWWQSDGPADGFDSPFAGPIVAFELMGMQDYLLFEQFASDVIAEGRFDNQWRVPQEDAETMRAVEGVTVTRSTVSSARP